jgi:hypothetical protein
MSFVCRSHHCHHNLSPKVLFLHYLNDFYESTKKDWAQLLDVHPIPVLLINEEKIGELEESATTLLSRVPYDYAVCSSDRSRKRHIKCGSFRYPDLAVRHNIFFAHKHSPLGNMGSNTIAIFPASGGIGGGTYQHLLNLVDAKNVILVARSPDKIPEKYRNAGAVTRYGDYDHLETLDHAFDGACYLNLISYASIEHEHRYKVRNGD